MGANTFYTQALGKTAKEAFAKAVEQALYDNGHAGYSGTIAEKSEFKLISVPAGEDPQKFAEMLVEKDDPRVEDKWGPAGCIALGGDSYLFFGWASS